MTSQKAMGPGTLAVLDGPCERRRVLIVDDNVDAADSLSMILRAMGNDTCTAYNGMSALSSAESFRPDAVVLDLGLPIIDGYMVARRLRDQFDASKLQLIAVTGHGQPSDFEQSRAAGFDTHLVKPCDPTVIQDLLTKAIRNASLKS
jgi:CheY-like chemotaxis protein